MLLNDVVRDGNMVINKLHVINSLIILLAAQENWNKLEPPCCLPPVCISIQLT